MCRSRRNYASGVPPEDTSGRRIQVSKRNRTFRSSDPDEEQRRRRRVDDRFRRRNKSQHDDGEAEHGDVRVSETGVARKGKIK